MSKAPWQRSRVWKGGWIEGWCTDLRLQCSDVGRPESYVGERNPCRNGCTCDQEELHAPRTKRSCRANGAAPQRGPDGQCKAWRVRIIGGEENQVHAPAPSPIPRLPKMVTVDWFLANGWKGSEVTRRPTPRGVEVTLSHPSGAVLRIRDDAVGFAP
jgi:hypothetical protein